MARGILTILVALGALQIPIGAAPAAKELYGFHKGKIVLRPSDKPHRLKGLMTVGREAVLIVQAGAILYFDPTNNKGGTLKILGRLLIQGTRRKPVIFLADVPAQVIIGDISIKDSPKAKARDPAGAKIAGAYFHKVGLQINGGVNLLTDLHLEQGRIATLGDTPIMAMISGGKNQVQRCTFQGDGAGHGLVVNRWDTYPTLTLNRCVFARNAVGLAVITKTLRSQRAPILVRSCNFQDNGVDLAYRDDQVPFRPRSCYFSGAKSVREARERMQDAGGRGIIAPSGVARRPILGAGAKFSIPPDADAILATVSGRPQGAGGTPTPTPAPAAAAQGAANPKAGAEEDDEADDEPASPRKKTRGLFN